MKWIKRYGLRFCINKLIPFQGYTFMNLFTILFTRSENLIDKMTEKTKAHERFHTKQMYGLLIIPYYLIYVLEFLIKSIVGFKWAYSDISFEREARWASTHQDYNDSRDTFSLKWMKFILNETYTT